MNSHLKLGIALLAGFGLGAATVPRLQAQVGPPAYVISEIDVRDAEAYAREYVPLAKQGAGRERPEKARLGRQDSRALGRAAGVARGRVRIRQPGEGASGLNVAGLP